MDFDLQRHLEDMEARLREDNRETRRLIEATLERHEADIAANATAIDALALVQRDHARVLKFTARSVGTALSLLFTAALAWLGKWLLGH